jgi:hypothetical protein
MVVPGRHHRHFCPDFLEFRLVGQPVPLPGQLLFSDLPGGPAVGIRLDSIPEKEPQVRVYSDHRIPYNLVLPLLGAGAESNAADFIFRQGYPISISKPRRSSGNKYDDSDDENMDGSTVIHFGFPFT